MSTSPILSGPILSGPILSGPALAEALALRDLTDPLAGPHAVQLVVERITSALTEAWRVPLTLLTPPRVVSVAENYDLLGYSSSDVTRASRYTRYASPTTMLRSHMSATIPAALRALPSPPPDVLLASPGICYRRDQVDATHVGEPHQLDLWRISPTPLSLSDLEEMAQTVVDSLLPGAHLSLDPSPHSYTLEGREMNVRLGREVMEIGECGLAHPSVLARCGVQGYGLAMGLGLDRLVMLAKGLDDIRLLRSSRPEISSQMASLAPYVPVPTTPLTRRDISIVVDDSLDVELLGDAARSALADPAPLREVSILSETPYAELPPSAVIRMGVAPSQKNVLLRLTLQADHTLTKEEANALRDQVYLSLHAGSASEV